MREQAHLVIDDGRSRVTRDGRPEEVQLRERRRVKGLRLHAGDAHLPQPPPQLAGGLRRERQGEHAVGGVRALVDAVRDAVGDDTGLAGAGAREHRDGTAQDLRRSTLRLVERVEWAHFSSYQARIRWCATEAPPGRRTSSSPASPRPISSRVNQRDAMISSPSGRTSDSSTAVAWKPSMSERGKGHACDVMYVRFSTRTPVSSSSSRCTVSSADSPASTKPAKHENISPFHAAFAPSSSLLR